MEPAFGVHEAAGCMAATERKCTSEPSDRETQRDSESELFVRLIVLPWAWEGPGAFSN